MTISEHEMMLIDDDVHTLLVKWAIIPSKHESEEIISNFFLVQKKRSMISLKNLNDFVFITISSKIRYPLY